MLELCFQGSYGFQPCEDKDKNGVCDVEEEVVAPVVPRCADKNKNGICDNLEKDEEGEEQVN